MKYLIVAFSVLYLCACGVKGYPVPPDSPPPLGHGQPTFSRATEQLKVKKHKPIEGDFNDQDDFNDSED